MYKHQQGFSLVELSIVLVILGLLTGGILGGQALIKAAELRAITTEIQQWQTAVNTFKQRYFALPGDFTKAGNVWGYVNTGGTGGNCSNPATNKGTGTQTCNGNGNGQVDLDYEMYRFWQHMANAGLISGEYTGVAGSGGVQHSVIGENVPAGKYGGSGWGARSLFNMSGLDGLWFTYDYGNHFFIGSSWTDSMSYNGLLTPEEAWNIDTKMDDGRPGQGAVVAFAYSDCVDETDADDGDIAEYMLSGSSTRCALNFVKAF